MGERKYEHDWREPYLWLPGEIGGILFKPELLDVEMESCSDSMTLFSEAAETLRENSGTKVK